MIDDYRKKCFDQLAKDTVTYRNYDIDQVILPKLGAREVRKITPTDIVDMIANSKRKWSICKRILT
ncbi:integrase, partial [bacterium]|nr:integrase [bacterium]